MKDLSTQKTAKSIMPVIHHTAPNPVKNNVVSVQEITKSIMPIVRRVIPNPIRSNIISVQPMAAPNNSVKYFHTIYDPWGNLNRIKDLPLPLQEKMKNHVIILVSDLKTKDLTKIFDAKNYEIRCIPKNLVDNDWHYEDNGDFEYCLNGISKNLVTQIMIILGGEVIVMEIMVN
jgi:hypothetical protein